MKGIPYREVRIIGSSVSLLQRLQGKMLRICKNLYNYTLWKICHGEQYEFHSLYSTAICIKQTFLIAALKNSSFPYFLKAEQRTPSLLFARHPVRWRRRAWVPQCAPSTVCTSLLLANTPHKCLYQNLCLSVFEFLGGWWRYNRFFKKYPYGPGPEFCNIWNY